MKYIIKVLKFLLIFAVVAILGIVLFFGHSDLSLAELKPKYANNPSSFISVDGMDVHFRDEGNPNDSIPLILIHGTGASLHTFDAWSKNLKLSRRVIRMDLPAYGLTGAFPDGNYSIPQYTSFLKDFLTTLNIKHCVLAGNSLGGQIAWNFTLEQPEMVSKLILIDAAGYPMNSKSVPIAFTLAKTPVLNKALLYVTPRFLVKSSVENVYFDTSKVTDSIVDRYFDLTLRAGNRKAFVDRFKIKAQRKAYEKIKNITQPTLILWGAQDLLIPLENAYKFQKNLPNDTLVIFENSGHVPMEENSEESLKPVIEFLKQYP